jgi:hypothetical protein
MALFNESQLRALAKSRASQAFDSVSDALRKSMKAAAELSAFDIFLSHSYLDRELILGITHYLEGLGYVVYVDWREDSQLKRDKVTKATAEAVRGRINQSKSLFFATTDAAKNSRWMPWELGYMDGKKGKSAILPVTQDSSTDDYKGQEYLGVYPYITSAQSRAGKDRIWVRENAGKYVAFDDWLNGKQPYVHD